MINVNINLKAESAEQAIKFAEALQAHFGSNAAMVFNAPRMASSASTGASGNRVADIIARSKARLLELGLDRAPKATSKEMALRAEHDKTGANVNWAIDLLTREAVMRDGYSYDIYANNKGAGAGEPLGAVFEGSLENFVPDED
jgi:hypothetical protein